jgi:hypothetical protein
LNNSLVELNKTVSAQPFVQLFIRFGIFEVEGTPGVEAGGQKFLWSAEFVVRTVTVVNVATVTRIVAEGTTNRIILTRVSDHGHTPPSSDIQLKFTLLVFSFVPNFNVLERSDAPSVQQRI